MDDKWAGQALKIQLEGLLSPTKFCTRLGCSMRWHVEVALRTMYLLMVGKIGLRLVNCDNRVLLALSRLRRRIVNNTTQTGTANAQKRIEALPRSIGWEKQRQGGHIGEFRGPATRKAEWHRSGR